MKHLLNGIRVAGTLALVVAGQALAQDAAQPSVTLIVSDKATDIERFAASELQRYIKELFKVDAPLQSAPAPGKTFRVQAIEGAGLSEQGILIRPEGDALLVGGGSPRAALWAVYELVERWGVRYLVHGDVLPDSPGPLRFPESEIRLEPNMRVRCWRLVNDLALGPVSWSLEENVRFLHQIAKMKYNRVHLSLWPCQPFVTYSFRGMEKPPPVLYFGERYPIDFDTVGREKFGGASEFTNPDFAGAASPQDLVARAQGLAHGILKEARVLGMETGISIQVFEWPKEFMAVLPGSEPANQLGSLTAGPGKSQSMDDPLLREMVATIIRAYVETYPEADYVHIGMPEHRGWTEQARQAYDALDARYDLKNVGTFDDLCARAQGRTGFPGGGERVLAMLKGDLAALAFLDSLLRERNLLTRPDGTQAKLVYSNVVEELFPAVSRMMPPGGEVLSFIDYTASRQLRQRDLLHQRPPERLPADLIFTLADDNVGVLPQLATGSLHELMQELRANGWSGFYTRYWTVGDLNPTVHYLARASWDAGVTPEAAYRDLIGQVCGPESVDPALSALTAIEAITKGLDQHGLGFGFPVPGMMTKHYDSGGLSPDLKTDHVRYREALDALRTARQHSKPAGAKLLDYLIGRLDFAVKYLDAAEQFGATATSERQGNRLAAATAIEQAYTSIRDAVTSWADVAEDHGDLGAVALLNAFCYRPIRDKRNELAGGAEILERIPIGETGDYKPCLAKLPNGELLVTAFHQNDVQPGKIREDILLFRSQDGGKTWSKGQVLDVLGREPYLSVTSDGAVLMTVHLLPQDIRNQEGHTQAYVHASYDSGATWTSLRIQSEGVAPGTEFVTSRNIVELADGSLMMAVSGNKRGCDFIWRSTDKGRTWAEKYSANVEGIQDDYPWQFFGEAVLRQSASGKIWAIARVDSKFFPPLPGHVITLGETDHYDRMMLFSSVDLGHTWKRERDFGDYGEMYPAVLGLPDGRLLLTFTVREVKRPLGVQAVLGAERADGYDFQFDSPRFLLDTKTPNAMDSGGGFGCTVRLADDTFATSYSYRGADNNFHCEAARWRLPALPPRQMGDLTGPWQLFVDDALIAEKTDVVRSYHAFEKCPGNPVLKPDKPWEGRTAYLYGTVLPMETGRGYRMWYHSWADGEYRILYATSNDGVHWDKPSLGIVPENGSKENNRVLRRTVEDHNPQVIHTPWEIDPQRRYKLINFDYGRTPPDHTVTGYYGAWSADGLHWIDAAKNPVLPDSPGDVGNFAWDAHKKRYLGCVKKFADVRGFNRRCVAVAETTDFESWPPSRLVLTPDEFDDRWAEKPGQHTEFYGLCGFPYESMYLGFLWLFRITDGNNDGPIFVELVSSRDGVTWTRQEQPREPVLLPLGPSGAWDSGMIFTTNHPLVEGDQVKLYYGGASVTHAVDGPIAIGMATLRKDGFASLDAGEKIGIVKTNPLPGVSGPLWINYAARKGCVKVEVVNENGDAIPGYCAEDCVALTGDSVCQPVTWAHFNRLPERAGPIRLRLLLHNASLYSFAIGREVR